MRNTTIPLLLFSLLLGGCYHAGGNDAATDAGSDAGTSDPEPGDLAWAVSLGEYMVSSPQILDVDENGNIRVLAGLNGYNPDAEDLTDHLGWLILTFDADGNFVEHTPDTGIDFFTREVARLGDSFVFAGYLYASTPWYWDARLARMSTDGSLEWKIEAGGNSDSSVSYGLAVDGDGNIWTTGSFSDPSTTDDEPVTFTFGDSSQSLALSDGTSFSSFIAVHDSDGNLLRLTRLISGVNSTGKSIAVSPDGSVYVSGTFQAEDSDGGGTATFGEGENAVSYSFSGEGDGYIAKLTGEGDLEWVMTVVSPSSAFSPLLAVAPNGHVRLAGAAAPVEQVTFEHPDFQPIGFEAAGIFLADVSPDGEVTLFDSPHGEHSAIVTAHEVTEDGASVVAGSFCYHYPIFDPSLDSWAANPASGGDQDTHYAQNTFTAVYGPEGDFEWVLLGETGLAATRTLSLIEGDDGSILSTGMWNGDCFDCWLFTGGPITFAQGEENETTLYHEDLQHTGFLTKSYR